MPRFLGIDPGSRICGFGIVERAGSTLKRVANGVIKTAAAETFEERLKMIYLGITEVCQTYTPHHVAIEKAFFAKNALSALKLGQARGAALTALSMAGFTVREISPNEVKQSIVGYGHADKDQVQKMVERLLRISSLRSQDASDALAIAITLSNCQEFYLKRSEGAKGREL